MITVKQYVRHWREPDKSVCNAEEIIDKAIASCQVTPITIDLSKVGALSSQQRGSLTKIYGDGEWLTRWIDGDQRDPGPFLELTLPR